MSLTTYFDDGMDYAAYRQLIDQRLREKRSTAPAASDNDYLVRYSRRNKRLMKKLEGSIELLPELQELLSGWSKPMHWLVITEGWCPDAGNILPYFEAIAAASDHLSVRYVLRDEHPELMDRFLTKGSRSIPILVAFEPGTDQALFTWGPRPEPAQAIVVAAKAHGTDKNLTTERIKTWYETDAGATLQEEFRDLLQRMQIIYSSGE